MAKRFEYDEVPEVCTKAGKIRGYKWDGIYIFKGITYAHAKRFQMPEEPQPWEGVREAVSYGFVCPLLQQDTPTGEILVPHRYWPQDENCLNLNIWTPSLDSKEKKPVMVWLHGGGYTAGSAIEQKAYNGLNMSSYGDVVVVSVNHRLNILGFLDLAPFGEKYKNSANAGLADLVAALKWIRENIEVFGGDASNVTLFGQSGGGMKVTGLMQIPEADGLFHKAIVMSGVSDGKLLGALPGDGTDIVKAILKELKLSETEVEKLETVPYYELANAYNKVSVEILKKGKYIGGAPMINDYYKGEPLLTGFREHAQKIPLMVGSVFGEFFFRPLGFDKYNVKEEKITEMLKKVYGENWERVKQTFTRTYPDKQLGDLLALDRIFRIPSKDLVKLHAQHSKAKAFLYHFTLDFPYQNGKIAWHCSDIPFAFHNTDKIEICNIEGVTKQLESQIFHAFIQFARTGNPNHPDIPEWEEVTADRIPTMIFDKNCELRINYDDELMTLLEEIMPPISLATLFEQDIQH